MHKTKMLKTYLKKFFGFEQFRKNQRTVIENILAEKNTLVIMPTGIGKSLCYQLPALIKPGTAIVISPLIALMKDQVDALAQKKIQAGLLTSSLSKSQLDQLKENLKQERFKMLYISPESFNKKDNILLFKQLNLSFIAVDEAHCISSWGHDFRPEYRKIRESINKLGRLPIIALTATATKKVEEDIIHTLEIKNANIFKSSFDRKNLYYEVQPKNNPEKQIIQFIKSKPEQTGIIYCQSKKKVKELTLFLRNNDIKAASYHASLTKSKRAETQDQFLHNQINVIVATIAFGMGINKPNVRFIIHYNCPKSIENYYQETGRAGRDGQQATCILYYDKDDITRLKKFNNNKPVSERKNANATLKEISQFATCAICRRKQLLYYFGELYQGQCNYCDNCKHPSPTYQGQDAILLLLQVIKKTKQKMHEPHIIRILCGIEDEHIQSYEHHLLPLFGKGKNHSPSTWESIIRQALLHNYITKEDAHEDAIITLAPQGNQFLQAPHPIKLYKEKHLHKQQDSKITTPEQHTTHNLLLSQLHALRQEESKKRNIMPYLIFQEQTLKAMSQQLPITLQALSHLSGVGISKATKFGTPFINLIKAYLKEHNIEPLDNIIIKSNPAKFTKKIHLIQQIDKKIALQTIAKTNNLTIINLLKDLKDICCAGVKLNLSHYINNLLDEEDIDILYDYFYEAETDNIEQAIEDMQDDYTEEEIRLVHIKFLSEVAY